MPPTIERLCHELGESGFRSSLNHQALSHRVRIIYAQRRWGERISSLLMVAPLHTHPRKRRLGSEDREGRWNLHFLLTQKDLRRRPTHPTLASHGGLPVFHGDLLRVLHLGLLFALDTVCFHCCSHPFL
jgi:hypothetical protein